MSIFYHNETRLSSKDSTVEVDKAFILRNSALVDIMMVAGAFAGVPHADPLVNLRRTLAPRELQRLTKSPTSNTLQFPNFTFSRSLSSSQAQAQSAMSSAQMKYVRLGNSGLKVSRVSNYPSPPGDRQLTTQFWDACHTARIPGKNGF